jgi:hypothetical protein
VSSPAVSTSTNTRRLPLGLAGTTTGIGSLPFTSSKSAIQSLAELAPEVPFWPQLPRVSRKESIIGQGLGIVADLIEPRNSGYGYQVKEGRIDAVIDAFHQSNGHLPPENASGFGAFEAAMRSQIFPSALAVKGQIEGPITLAAYLFHKGRPFLSDADFLLP